MPKFNLSQLREKQQLLFNLLIKTLIVGGILFCIFSIFFFFNLMEVPLGLLFGLLMSLAIEAIDIKRKTIENDNSLVTKGIILTFICYLGETFLYIASLYLCMFLYHIDIKIFSWFSCLIGLLIIKIIKYIIIRRTSDEHLA